MVSIVVVGWRQGPNVVPGESVIDWITNQINEREQESGTAIDDRLEMAQLYSSREYMNLSNLSLQIQKYICGYACVRANHTGSSCCCC